MSFNYWNKVLSNPIYKNICKNIQENIVNEMNFHDLSVGIEWTSKIDQSFVDDINENCEGCIVLYWGKYEIFIEVDNSYMVSIKLITIGEESNWEITNFDNKDCI